MVDVFTGHEHETGVFMGREQLCPLLVLTENDGLVEAVRKIMDIDIRTVLLIIDAREIEQIDLVRLVQRVAEILSEIQHPAGAVRFEDRYDLLVGIAVSGSFQSDLDLGRVMSVVVDENGVSHLLDLEAALSALTGMDGRGVGEAVVEDIFARFCVGK